MFIGHGLLAFTLVILIVDRWGWSRERALTAGLLAAAFATIPDVDVVHALGALDTEAATEIDPDPFWSATQGVHRAMTHSLFVGVIAGLGFGAWSTQERQTSRLRLRRAGGGLLLGGLIIVGGIEGGVTGVGIMGLFVLAGLMITTLASTYTTHSPRAVSILAMIGLLSHPWGDMLTGTPPAFLYPFDVQIIDGLFLFHSDPTLHLLGAFALELGLAWAATLGVLGLYGVSPRSCLDRLALLGTAYGVAAVTMAPPTIDVAYEFVFTILTVGAITGSLTIPERFGTSSPPETDESAPARVRALARPICTALGGVTVALGSYLVVYLIATPS